ncbi:Uncharacterised protein [Mycobacteroides abscessus subsp. abscessus]|nr:Uncharacterised protein [Mycobacteroides abscessus subsp. abscessus]
MTKHPNWAAPWGGSPVYGETSWPPLSMDRKPISLRSAADRYPLLSWLRRCGNAIRR